MVVQCLFKIALIKGTFFKLYFYDQGKSDLQHEMDKLYEEKTALEHQITDIRQKAEQAERRAAELRSAEEKKHAEEIAFLKKTNAQLKVGVPLLIYLENVENLFYF